ncbi:hypothetical protein EGT07_02620 [Herbaspirillum sp. HC18]|nr:hypothetical protein EGT07_02620 [Herbaspirillum sp. HC18]
MDIDWDKKMIVVCKRVFFWLFMMLFLSAQAEEGQSKLPANMWPEFKTLTGIKVADESTALVQLIVLFDANCPHCAKLWSRLYGKESRHRGITSLWVPVAYMGNDSAGKAAQLLTSNSLASLAENFEKFDFDHRRGAAIPINVSHALKLSLDRNTRTWQKLMAATPLLIYRTKDGAVFTQIGLPPDPQLNELLDKLAPKALAGYTK